MNAHHNTQRQALEVKTAQEVMDGDGVRIRRSLGLAGDNRVDPFLLLDEFVSDDAADYIGGFPEHPHRGFETVTYMLEGKMRHRDHLGNEGLLQDGGVQWMTAGRGVLHSEMPEQSEGKMHGFQLWVNLAAKDKMVDANYQEFSPEQIPTVDLGEGSQVKVIAGSFADTTGPVQDTGTQPDYFDFHLSKEKQLNIPIKADKNALIYVYKGEVSLNDGAQLSRQQYGQLSEGDSIDVKANKNSRFLIIAGKAINEPVVQWGPFVMNTMEEVDQAIRDFRNGELV